MPRYIDAEALKKDLTRFYDGEVTARELIDEQPTATGALILEVITMDRLTDKRFVDIEVLQAKNTKVLAIDGTRVSQEKGYGMMSVIAKFEVPVSDIREIIDSARMDGESE